MTGARYIPKCGDLIGLNNIPLFALTPKKKKPKNDLFNRSGL